MFNKSKWLKWKIGAIGALGIFFMFNQVKSTPAFEHAVAGQTAAANNQTEQQTQSQDSIENWLNASGNDPFASSTVPNYNDTNSQLPSFNTHSHTRTGRS